MKLQLLVKKKRMPKRITIGNKSFYAPHNDFDECNPETTQNYGPQLSKMKLLVVASISPFAALLTLLTISGFML